MGRESTTASVHPTRTLRLTALATLIAFVAVDQVVKWWAWHNTTTARINYGGNVFVGATVGRWFAHPVTGALLDLVDFGVLSVAVAVLLHRRRPAIVVVTGTLMISGWVSNLADRLGLHYWTAPGSVRGAVDFIHLGRIYYNVADVFIVVGTLLFGLTVWATSKTAGSWTPPATRLRARGWMSAAAAAVCLIGVVGFGAVNYGGVTTPSAAVVAGWPGHG